MKDNGIKSQGLISTKLTMAFLIAAICTSPADANCDLPHMLSVLANLPNPARIIRVEEIKQESTDGGSWAINLDKMGLPQSIVRNLNGETRYEEVIYVRFKGDELAIANQVHKFQTAADGVQKLETDFSALAVICADRTVVTVFKDGPNPNLKLVASSLLDAASALKSAEDDRRRLFESPEIKPYVDKMKRW